MTSRMTSRVSRTGQVIGSLAAMYALAGGARRVIVLGQPAICPLEPRLKPRFQLGRLEPVPQTPPNLAVLAGQPSARSLEFLGQPRIRAARRREPMPETLLWRADLGRPPMQLAAPGRVHQAVDDELADSISELNLPTKPTELAELAELRTFREQSGLGGLG
jgi:hypothetical protein